MEPRVDGELDPERVPADAIRIPIPPDGDGDEDNENSADAGELDNGDDVVVFEMPDTNWSSDISENIRRVKLINRFISVSFI